MADEATDALAGEDALEAQLKALEKAEKAIDYAFDSGRKERAQITRDAQKDAEDAVAMVGVALESDEAADEARRMTAIVEGSGSRERVKEARKVEREARKKAKEDHKAATRSAKQAYDAIKFSDPNSMGFMRVVQVIFAIHIASVLIMLILTSRDVVEYSFANLLDWAMVVLEGIAFFFFINRYKIGRPFAIFMALVGLIAPAVYDAMSGKFSLLETLVSGSFYVFLIFYFIFSDRVKATLINDVSMHKGEYEAENFVIERRGWPFLRNLIIFFLVFSTLGHFMEVGMCQFIIMGLVEGDYDPTNTMLWRDLMFPFPMEGAVVVIIALFLYPFYMWMKKKFKPRILAYIVSFVTSALLCSLIEFSMGLIVNSDLQLWDYSNHFGNIMGQVCLQNTLAFGAAASIINWWVYPMLERWIARIPNDIMNIVFVVVLAFNAVIWSLYIIVPPWISNENKTPEELAQLAQQKEMDKLAQERDGLSIPIGIIDSTADTLRSDVMSNAALTDAERESMLAEIDDIVESVYAMQDTLAGDGSAEGDHVSETAVAAGS